jgi:hypothetical protein
MIIVSKVDQGWELVDPDQGFDITCFDGGFFVDEANDNRLTVQYEPIPPGMAIEVWMSYKEKLLPVRRMHFISDLMEWPQSINEAIASLSQTPETLPIAHITGRGFTKGDLAVLFKFKERFKAYDTALPQFWLDKLAAYGAAVDRRITYDLILSTTFWVYEEGDSMGKAVSCCFEVKQLILNFNRTHNLR